MTTKEAAYTELLVRQGGVCAICRRGSKKTLHIDHDHKTGKVRGLLCFRCNVAIGHLRDSSAMCYAAFIYLLGDTEFHPENGWTMTTVLAEAEERRKQDVVSGKRFDRKALSEIMRGRTPIPPRAVEAATVEAATVEAAKREAKRKAYADSHSGERSYAPQEETRHPRATAILENGRPSWTRLDLDKEV